jgi:hypothetical protein
MQITGAGLPMPVASSRSGVQGNEDTNSLSTKVPASPV